MFQLVLVLAALIGQVGEDHGLTILDMHATWCQPCQNQRPRIAILVDRGYPIRTVDVDEDQATAKLYNVKSVPTLVLIDENGKELSRRVGPYTAVEIANWYRGEFKKKAAAAQSPRPPPAQDASVDQKSATNDTFASACRIANIVVTPGRNEGAGWRGYGSGTIIGSSDTEAIVITCAHLFEMGNPRKLPAPQYPGKIEVNLSDGKVDGEAGGLPKTKFGKTFVGTAVDYDFTLDVGLIRIATTERLPVSRVVPKSWTPTAGMSMHVVGCATAGYPTRFKTKIRNPRHGGVGGGYVGIQCDIIPKQGRSGGGLFTDDGFLAGITDFASPSDNSGLYAHPTSLYAMLDRNGLKSLYSSKSSDPVETEPVADSGGDRKIGDIEAACLNIFKRLGKPGQKGDKGDKGDTGQKGKDGADGKNGIDGEPGKDGAAGKDATGAPVDLTAILNRLTLIEGRLQDLEDEAKKPLTVAIKLPDGTIKKHDFPLTPLKDGSTGIGAKYPGRRIGLDFSDFAVPAKTPSK